MRSQKRRLGRTQFVASFSVLLILSAPALSQTEPKSSLVPDRSKIKGTAIGLNPNDAQRRTFATSLLISLATEAKSFKDPALRPRILARTADALWEIDNLTARALFNRAWDAAELADREEVTIKKTGKGEAPPAIVMALRKLGGNDLRLDVLALISHRDQTLAEQFLAKLKTENTREASEADKSNLTRNAYSGPESNLKRLLIARKLLADGDVKAATQFAGPALTDVNANSIEFLSQLRLKDPTLADSIFADLLTRTSADPAADANTISGLSSYAFTPGFYIVFRSDGGSTWTQPEGPTVAPNINPDLRSRFFQVGTNVLLKPSPPPDQDFTSCGRRGRLKVITRLLPLFDQFSTATASLLRAELTAREGRNIDTSDSLLTEGIQPEVPPQNSNVQEQLDRAKSSRERDQIYAAAAARLAPTGNERARHFANSIEEAELRARIRNYVDFEFIKNAIHNKKAATVDALATGGELTHIQRSWAFTQAATLLFEAQPENAVEVLQKALLEAERMNQDDPDASFALLNIANRFLTIDQTRTWEILDKTVKFANSAEDFVGDDIQTPTGAMIVTASGTRFVRLPSADFSFSRVLRSLANEDFFRSIEVARSFKYDAARAYATLAVAKAVLETSEQTASARVQPR